MMDWLAATGVIFSLSGFVSDRIEAEPMSGCWIWVGDRSQKGYARIGRGRAPAVHRLIYRLMRGPIPDGLQLDHLCRVRACVNPNHLELVTRKENILRGIGPTANNARKTHCPRGHIYDDSNTYHSRGQRECRTCKLRGQRGRKRKRSRRKLAPPAEGQ
jgi:HNH endonuclease